MKPLCLKITEQGLCYDPDLQTFSTYEQQEASKRLSRQLSDPQIRRRRCGQTAIITEEGKVSFRSSPAAPPLLSVDLGARLHALEHKMEKNVERRLDRLEARVRKIEDDVNTLKP